EEMRLGLQRLGIMVHADHDPEPGVLESEPHPPSAAEQIGGDQMPLAPCVPGPGDQIPFRGTGVRMGGEAYERPPDEGNPVLPFHPFPPPPHRRLYSCPPRGVSTFDAR